VAGKACSDNAGPVGAPLLNGDGMVTLLNVGVVTEKTGAAPIEMSDTPPIEVLGGAGEKDATTALNDGVVGVLKTILGACGGAETLASIAIKAGGSGIKYEKFSAPSTDPTPDEATESGGTVIVFVMVSS
jgi:hypothetical protein